MDPTCRLELEERRTLVSFLDVPLTDSTIFIVFAESEKPGLPAFAEKRLALLKRSSALLADEISQSYSDLPDQKPLNQIAAVPVNHSQTGLQREHCGVCLYKSPEYE